jgi:hypothetical protein
VTLRLVGDGRSVAVLSPDASVQRWCAPEFDDRPLCWRLLDGGGGTARFPGLEYVDADDVPARATLLTRPRPSRYGIACCAEVDGVLLVRLLRRRPGLGRRACCRVRLMTEPRTPAPSLRVDHDKNKGWIAWLVGLLLLALLAVVLFFVFVFADDGTTIPNDDAGVMQEDDADDELLEDEDEEETEEPASGQSPLALTPPFTGLAAEEGRQVTVAEAQVVDVPADEAFTIGSEARSCSSTSRRRRGRVAVPNRRRTSSRGRP